MSSKQTTEGAGRSWLLLRAGGHDTGGLEIPTVPTDVSTPAGPARIAVGPNGEPRVLLPLSERATVQGLASTRSISIETVTLTHKGRTSRFLDITCRARELETVFAEVVDEMLARIVAGQDCVSAARSTLDDFQTLLVPSGNGVETARISGLVGELLVLNRLLDRSSSAWRTWRGPAGDRHDFRAGDCSLEVKTSSRADTSSILVNGLEQLEPPSGGRLFLARFILEPVQGGLLQVSMLARSALGKCDMPHSLGELIRASGCDDIDSHQWNRQAFRLEREEFYQVGAGFPRLTSSMLLSGSAPAGVSAVSYAIDLSLAKAFLLTPDASRSIEEEFI